MTALLSATVLIVPDSGATGNIGATNQPTQSSPTIAYSCSCVAFRLDDIQDYFLTNAQMEIINTFEQKDANLTIGVIGNSFGDDVLLAIFLKEKISRYHEGNSSFALEVANHGWNHEDFTQFDKEEQAALIRQTSEKIYNILDVRPLVFIPPYNAMNNNTVAALLENDIHYVSANVTFYPATILHDNRNDNDTIGSINPNTRKVLHFPSAAVTGDLNDDNTEWLGYSHDASLAAINASVKELGYAVVTMHPMEFSLRNVSGYQDKVDFEQIRELELLIDDIRSAGFRIVTISEIDQDNIAAIPEFSTYSTYAILAAAIGVVIWFSIKNHRIISPHGDNRFSST